MKSELLNRIQDSNEDPTLNVSEEIHEISDDEDSLDGYDDGTVAEAAFTSAVDCIDRLYKLSMKVRNPTARTGLSKGYAYRKIDEETSLDLFDCFANLQIDEAHIKSVYFYKPGINESASYLLSRLAKANNQRRRQFAYWSQHKLNLVKRSRKITIPQKPFQMPPDIATSSASKYSRPTTATQLDRDKINLDDAMSAISINIHDIMDSACDFIVFPDPPEKYTSQQMLKEFECPYCYTTSSRRLLNKQEWRYA